MADESDEIGQKAFGPDALAARLALDAVAVAEAREYLRRQNELAQLQIENLRKQDEFETSHLRWRRFNDQMKGALQIMGVLVGLVIVVAIGAALWSASQADGLIIDAPSTPPALAEKGLTGSVIAAKLLDRLTAMEEATDSARASSSFQNDWSNDIKVQIADTGISIGQVVAYLHSALGHERYLTGELTETPSGLALTLRLSNEPGQTVTGSQSDLDGLIQKAAETVFERDQPYRYARYIQRHDKFAEALDMFRRLSRGSDPVDRAWGISGVALSMAAIGNFPAALDAARRGRKIAPQNPLMDATFATIDEDMGHAEDDLANNRLAAQHLQSGDTSAIKPELLPTIRAEHEQSAALLFGDYREAARLDAQLALLPDYQGSVDAASPSLVQDLAEMHDMQAARTAILSTPQDEFGEVDFALGIVALQMYDWRGVADHMRRSEGQYVAALAKMTAGSTPSYYHRVTTGPFMAYAAARLGNTVEAERLLRELPMDCYMCARVHGQVASVQGRYAAAAWWFAKADRLAPSLPFAASDWGEMLLARGDLDGAIEKFASAHNRSPHFADPLEMWGEALMQKNRSDLALAKFEEANDCAPNWGRLHLKWGEALWWLGRRDDARNQFAMASVLYMTAPERSQLSLFR